MPMDVSESDATISRSCSERILELCFFSSERGPPLSRLNTNEQRLAFLSTSSWGHQTEQETCKAMPTTPDHPNHVQKKLKLSVIDETPKGAKTRKALPRKKSARGKAVPSVRRKGGQLRSKIISDDDDCDEPAKPATRRRTPTANRAPEPVKIGPAAADLPIVKKSRRGRKPGGKHVEFQIATVACESKDEVQPHDCSTNTQSKPGKSSGPCLEREFGVSEALTRRLSTLVERLESAEKDKGHDEAARALAKKQVDFLAQVSHRLKSQTTTPQEIGSKANSPPTRSDHGVCQELKELRSQLQVISNQTEELAANHSKQMSAAQSETQAVLAKLELVQQTANSQAHQLALVQAQQRNPFFSQHPICNDAMNQLPEPSVAPIQRMFPAGVNTAQFQPVVDFQAGLNSMMRSHCPSSLQPVPTFIPGVLSGDIFGSFQKVPPSQAMLRMTSMPAQVPSDGFSQGHANVFPQGRPSEFPLYQQPTTFSVQGPLRAQCFPSIPQVVRSA